MARNKEGKLFVSALAGLLTLNVVLLGVCDTTPPPPRPPVRPTPAAPRPEIRPPADPVEPLPPGEEINPPCSWSLLAWGCWNGLPPLQLAEGMDPRFCLLWARPH